jgi:outer membrane receptor protein involved in Fe transport
LRLHALARSLLVAAAFAGGSTAGLVGPQAAWAQGASDDTSQTAPAADEGAGEEAPETTGRRAAPPSGVEVIRIKGRAVTGIETEVPASVTQFDAGDLQELGAQNISDLAKVTPNVEIKTSGSTSPTFFIRGVGLSDFSANAAGAVAIYRDDVAINAPAIQLVPIFDLENVEVLRGPQGTGSNRNASAGAIKMYSRKPTGDTSAELRSTFANYDGKDFEGAIEAPIVDEMLATRLAFRFTERAPIAKNRCGAAETGEPFPAVPLSGPDDPRLPELPGPQPPAANRPRIAGPDYRAFCSESNVNAQFAQNPRFSGPYRHTPPPPPAIFQNNVDAQGDPRNVRISPLAGLDVEEDVNDVGNWAARGQLRFQPSFVDDMDWLLNVHGTRIDQLSTLGQAMGTGGVSGSGGSVLGGSTLNDYQEPDNLAQVIKIADGGSLNAQAYATLAERLALDLDERPFEGDYNRTGQTTLDNWGAALRGDWTLGPVTLTSVTGYERYWRTRDTDQDFTPQRLFESVSEDDAWQFFQDIKAAGELADLPFRWDIGAYYLMEDLYFYDSTETPLGGRNPLQTYREYRQELWSYGVYAGFSWDFLDDFTLEGGVRWNWDRKDIPDARFGRQDPQGPTPPDAAPSVSLVGEAPTGSLTLNYRFSEEIAAYWKYTRGWKPGTINSLATDPTARADVGSGAASGLTTADPETIDSWETGLRGAWLDGRLQVGSALFFYKYTDYQVFVVSTEGYAPSLIIINADDAQVYGAELDIRAEPLVDLVPPALEGLVLTVRGGWLESQFLDFTRTQEYPGASAGDLISRTTDYSGNQLINAPRFKVSGAAEWTLDLGRYGAVIPRYDFAWTSDIYFDPNEGLGNPDAFGNTFLPEYAVGQRRYWLHNVRLSYRVPDGNIEIAGWCRNLTDQVYKTYGFDATSFAKVVINFVGEPRTYGLDFTVRF